MLCYYFLRLSGQELCQKNYKYNSIFEKNLKTRVQVCGYIKYFINILYIRFLIFNRQAWQTRSLINSFSWLNKFYANNQFSKIIIKLNKKKIQLFVNSKTNKFLKEMIIFNVLALQKNKDIMARITKITKNRNWYFVIEIYNQQRYITMPPLL